MAESKAVGLSADDLQNILTTVLQESRKPVVTEKDARELEEQQNARAQSVEQIEAMRAQEEWNHHNCPHRRRDNSPRTVQVNAAPKSGGNYLLCQACQVVIRAEDEKGRRYENGTMYNNQLFNSLVVDQSPVIW